MGTSKIKLSIKNKYELILAHCAANGTKPYNASYNLGLTHDEAIKCEQEYNRRKEFLAHIPSHRDICERQGASLGVMVAKLRECAGIGNDPQGIPYVGATRVISAVNTGKEASGATSDFIEVPDWRMRIDAIKELFKAGEYINTAKAIEEKEQGVIINIIRPQRAEARKLELREAQ